MKTRNRVLAALMALVLAFGLTACGGGKEQTPQEVYAAALAKMSELSSMDADIDLTMNMTDGTDSMDITMAMGMKVQDLNKDTMAMDMSMDVSLMGMTMTIQAYYADGYYLMDMMGQKVKYAMSMEEAIEQASVAQEMDVQALGDIEMTEADGVKTLSYSIDAAKMEENSQEYLSILENLGLGDLGGTGMTYDTISGTMTVGKDGYVQTNSMTMTGSIEEAGQKMDVTMEMSMTYNNPGQDVKVEVPSADDYMEIDPSTLG